MSLINQMLHDLEQRRTAEPLVSPLGGLSASGSSLPPAKSINALMLALVLVMLFAGGIVAAYLLGAHKLAPVAATQVLSRTTPVAAEKTESPTPNKSVPRHTNRVEAKARTAVVEPAMTKPVSKQIARPSVNKPLSKPSKSEVSLSRAPQQAVSVDDEQNNPKLNSASHAENTESVMRIERHVDASERPAETPPPTTASVTDQNTALLAEDTNVNKTLRPLTREQQSQQSFQRAVKFLGRGKQAAAEAALEQALALDPVNIRARETLVALILNAGRVSEAAGSLLEGLRLVPNATPLAKLYARILVDQGDVADAVTVLERARPAVSADPSYHALLAALYRQVGKQAQAAQTYRQVLLVSPGVASWWMGLGLSLESMGEGEQAVEAYQRAMRAGGLASKVENYVQTRIAALTPVTKSAEISTHKNADAVDAGSDGDEE